MILLGTFLLSLGPRAGIEDPPDKSRFDGFARAIDVTADLDNDGIEDILVGDPNPDTSREHAGRFWVLSGRDGRALLSVPAPDRSTWFGSSVAYLASERPKQSGRFVIGATADYPPDSLDEWRNGVGGGEVHLFTDQGELVKSISLEGDDRRLGFVVSSAGDLDADKLADFIACAPIPKAEGGRRGVVILFSGSSGDEIGRVDGEDGDLWFARNAAVTSVAAPSRSVLMAYTRTTGSGRGSPAVVIASGTKNAAGTLEFKAARTVVATDQERSFGRCLKWICDLNGDGWPELAVTSPVSYSTGWEPGLRGSIALIDGHTGERLREISRTARAGEFGTDLAVTWEDQAQKHPRLLVTSAMRMGSSSGEALLLTYDAGTGRLVRELDLLAKGGMRVGIVHDSVNAEECIVTSCCDCDPAGFPGTVMVWKPNGKDHFVVRRVDAERSLEGRSKK